MSDRPVVPIEDKRVEKLKDKLLDADVQKTIQTLQGADPRTMVLVTLRTIEAGAPRALNAGERFLALRTLRELYIEGVRAAQQLMQECEAELPRVAPSGPPTEPPPPRWVAEAPDRRKITFDSEDSRFEITLMSGQTMDVFMPPRPLSGKEALEIADELQALADSFRAAAAEA